MIRTLGLASDNRHKLAELAVLLDAHFRGARAVEVRPGRSFAGYEPADETADTFEGNALLKAHALAQLTGLPCLADDSGLEVDALDGAPGVISARWAGRHGDDAANNEKLLREMADVPAERRTARFRCAIALVLPDGTEHVVHGACEGRIRFDYRGEGGFGYDPLFDVDGLGGRTMAELTMEEKNTLSHRARALSLALAPLGDLLDRHFAQEP